MSVRARERDHVQLQCPECGASVWVHADVAIDVDDSCDLGEFGCECAELPELDDF